MLSVADRWRALLILGMCVFVHMGTWAYCRTPEVARDLAPAPTGEAQTPPTLEPVLREGHVPVVPDDPEGDAGEGRRRSRA